MRGETCQGEIGFSSQAERAALHLPREWGGEMAKKGGKMAEKVGKAALSHPLCQGELGQSPALLIPGTHGVSHAKSSFPCSGMLSHASSTSLPSLRCVFSPAITHSCLLLLPLQPEPPQTLAAPMGSALSARSAPSWEQFWEDEGAAGCGRCGWKSWAESSSSGENHWGMGWKLPPSSEGAAEGIIPKGAWQGKGGQNQEFRECAAAHLHGNIPP